MKKIVLLFFMCSFLKVFAQSTSLEIDCQNPGWLSNMISYEELKNVQNLKVKGYINNKDLKFVGKMISDFSLRGCIDLEDANFVASWSGNNNIMPEYMFGVDGVKVSHVKYPLSMKGGKRSLDVRADTVTIGGDSLPSVDRSFSYYTIKHLVLREGVRILPSSAFNGGGDMFPAERDTFLVSVQIPSTLTMIGDYAFENRLRLKEVNFSGVDSIGKYAFKNTQVGSDTLYLPNIQYFHTTAFIKEGVVGTGVKVYYFGKNIKYIDDSYETSYYGSTRYHKFIGENKDKPLVFHIEAITPPDFKTSLDALEKAIVYVPKSSVEIYKRTQIWEHATILPEPVPTTSVEVDMDSLMLIKGRTRQLTASVLPTDADDKEVVWSSSDPDIVSVDQTGLITANLSGEAYIYARLVADYKLVDSCKVRVWQPVSNIAVNAKEKTLKVGESCILTVTVNPFDANNKNIVWTSSDSTIASVDNGKVVALNPGVVKITAASEENADLSDYCEITVTQPATGIELNYTTYTFDAIGQSLDLVATVLPANATNQKVMWKSSDESVCIVSNGKVVAIGNGVAVIIAVTEDGGYMATCTILVDTSNSITDVIATSGDYKVYEINGTPSTLLTKGLKIIHFADGTSVKIFVK